MPLVCSEHKGAWDRHGPGFTSDPLISPPRHIHQNARLTPLCREHLLRRHIDDDVRLATLVAQAGIIVRTACKMLLVSCCVSPRSSAEQLSEPLLR
jgi:hypothetical protein